MKPQLPLTPTAVITACAAMCAICCPSAHWTRTTARAQQPSATSTGAAIPVVVAPPQRRVMTRPLTLPATLLAGEMADLYAKTSGYIKSVNTDFGSIVSAGQALLEIDVPEMRDELREAQAVLQAKKATVAALKARSNQAATAVDIATAEVKRYQAEHALREVTLNRKKKLRAGNAISQQELDESESELAVVAAQVRIAQAKVKGAQAERLSVDAEGAAADAQVAVATAKIERLKTLMQYATIRAPFDGVVTNRLVDPGAFVRSATEGAATHLLSVAQIDRVRVKVDVPGPDAPFVGAGTKARVLIKALQSDPIEATVTRTSVALDPKTRTMRAEIDLDNHDRRLSPGMYAKVTLTLASDAQALMVPSNAIRASGTTTSVLVAVQGVAKMVPVTVGYDDGIWAQIVGGLTGDEPIIVSAGGVVTAGTAVDPS